MDGVLSGDLRPLGLADYEAVGGIRHSLEFELDGIWEGLAGPAQEIARKVFQRLTEQDAAGRLTRRPTRLSDLVAIAGAPLSEVGSCSKSVIGVEVSFMQRLAGVRWSWLVGQKNGSP